MARGDEPFDLDGPASSGRQANAESAPEKPKSSFLDRFKPDPFAELRRSPYARMLGLSKPSPWSRPKQDDDEDADDLDDDMMYDDEDEDDEIEDPTQDGDGSLQDGPDGEEDDPAQDEEGSLQDGEDAKDLDKEDDKKKKDDKNKKEDKKGGKDGGKDAKGGKGGGGGLPGKLKDPWDPEVTMEIAKVAGGIPPIPMPIPCPECKKMSLYLDKWINNGARLTILLSYIVGSLIITKSCPVQMKDAIQQVHFLCLNAKCKKFAFNSFKYKFVPEMTSGKMESRQWVFASPFPKMSVKDAEKIRRKVSNKNKKK